MAVSCNLCPHACTVREGQTGLCRTRVNRAGHIVLESYGRTTSLALDPIEKKPFARYQPKTTVLSLGSYGCNLRCPFCQNATIATAGADDVAWQYLTPEEIVSKAKELRHHRCIGIAYTYNEPFTFFEFMRDTATLAHQEGLKNVVVSNGMVSPEPLAEIAPLLDAANIDLKCFNNEGYRQIKGDFDTVKNTIKTLASLSTCHLEVTTLVVPGFSDNSAQIEAAAAWLASLDPTIPYHLTRFFPSHLMREVPPTPVTVIEALKARALNYLTYVYKGNC